MVSTSWGSECTEYFVWFCRLWGLTTALALWGIGIEVSFTKALVGYYIIAAACLVTLLETVFLVHLAVQECYREMNSTWTKVWSCLLSLDDWKKSILYFLLSVFCFLHQFIIDGEGWMSIIAGSMLVLSAIFYVGKTCTNSRLSLPNILSEPQNTYTRVDQTGDELGSGSITNDVPSQVDAVSIQSGTGLLSGNGESSLAEQTEIMEA